MEEMAKYQKFKKITLIVNRFSYDVYVDANMPLLWVLRDELGLMGTKYGCGAGLCGACSVLIDGVATRSCLLAAGNVTGEIMTIEGLGTPAAPDRLQETWIKEQVAQCGYCQPGQILTAHELLCNNPAPGDAEIERAMAGNLCRCGTYPRIKKAIKAAATGPSSAANENGKL